MRARFVGKLEEIPREAIWVIDVNSIENLRSKSALEIARAIIQKSIEQGELIEALRQVLADDLAKESKAFQGERQALINEARRQIIKSKKKDKVFGPLILHVRGKTTDDPTKQLRTIYACWRRIVNFDDRAGAGKKTPRTRDLKHMNGDVHCGLELSKFSNGFERGDILRLETKAAETRIAWRIMSLLKQRHVKLLPGLLRDLDQFPEKIEKLKQELFPVSDAQFPLTRSRKVS